MPRNLEPRRSQERLAHHRIVELEGLDPQSDLLPLLAGEGPDTAPRGPELKAVRQACPAGAIREYWRLRRVCPHYFLDAVGRARSTRLDEESRRRPRRRTARR